MRRFVIVISGLWCCLGMFLYFQGATAATPSHIFVPLMMGGTGGNILTATPTATATQTSTPTATATRTSTPTRTTGPITLEIVTPGAGALIGDDLRILVRARSTYEISQVEAHVGSADTPLVYSADYTCDAFGCEPGWRGSLSLASLERGQQMLVVEARDALGNIVETERPFVLDRLPVLSIDSPNSGTVARPDLPIAAQCIDDDPSGCVQLTLRVGGCGGSVAIQGTSAISQTISLAQYEGREVILCFVVRDTAGQQRSLRQPVYVESSSQLVEVARVRDSIRDVRAERILSHEGTETGNHLVVYTRGSDEGVIIATNVDLIDAYLTPAGVIYLERLPNPPYSQHVVEWRNGTLQDLGGANHSASLVVDGDYAIWIHETTLYRRDLVSGTTITISTDAGACCHDVTANGDVVYWGTNNNIYQFHDGVTTQLTSDTYPLQNSDVATDGVNVIYRKQISCCVNPTYAIAMHDGDGEHLLTEAREQVPYPGRHYQIQNGWIVFTRQGSSGVIQVWTRSPAGTERQLSFFSSSSEIEALSATGEVVYQVYQNSTHRYFATADGTATELDFTLGRMFWQDGQWYVAIGRSLFMFVPDGG